jgi:hypothetical protein
MRLAVDVLSIAAVQSLVAQRRQKCPPSYRAWAAHVRPQRVRRESEKAAVEHRPQAAIPFLSVSSREAELFSRVARPTDQSC